MPREALSAVSVLDIHRSPSEMSICMGTPPKAPTLLEPPTCNPMETSARQPRVSRRLFAEPPPSSEELDAFFAMHEAKVRGEDEMGSWGVLAAHGVGSINKHHNPSHCVHRLLHAFNNAGVLIHKLRVDACGAGTPSATNLILSTDPVSIHKVVRATAPLPLYVAVLGSATFCLA